MAFFKKLQQTVQLYKVDIEIFSINITQPKEVQAEMLMVEWKRGPQTDQSAKFQNSLQEDGTISIGSKFTRICNFRYNSKMEIQPKLCEFRLIGITKGKSKPITNSKKFDMTSRLDRNSKFKVDIGKGVSITCILNF